MKAVIRAAVLGVLLLAGPAYAQPPVAQVPVPAAVEDSEPKEQLTEADKTRIERVNLLQRIHQLETQNAELLKQLRELSIAKEIQQLQQDIEAAHPGFAWDAKTGAFTKPAP